MYDTTYTPFCNVDTSIVQRLSPNTTSLEDINSPFITDEIAMVELAGAEPSKLIVKISFSTITLDMPVDESKVIEPIANSPSSFILYA